MPIRREFLDWRKPALYEAVAHLRQRFARGKELDLGQVLAVLPTSRACRRLLEMLVAAAEEDDLAFTPPDLVTPDRFPEQVYQPKRAFANLLTQQLAWAVALASVPAERLAPLLPRPPVVDQIEQWLSIGQSLGRLHLELAADGLQCEQVLRGAEKLAGFSEHARWQVLSELEREYLNTLDRLELWDVQTARLVAIERREIATEKEVVLIGMADLNRAQRQMLDQIADRVSVLIVAPADIANRFDKHGCLVPAKWVDVEIPLTDEQIERVDGPADQAEAVTRWLGELDGKYRPDQIAIGVTDGRLVPQLQRELAQCGVASRYAEAKKLSETAPFRLLQVATAYAANERYRDLAALARHPDVYEWLVVRLRSMGEFQGDVLTVLDEFAVERVPARLDEERLAKDERSAGVLQIWRCLAELVQPLAGGPRPLAAWAEQFRGVLAEVYGRRELERGIEEDRYLIDALEQLAGAFEELAAAPPALQAGFDVRQACRLALEPVAASGLAPPYQAEAVELLGWLDLPLDDAPALVVTTFNEGYVPQGSSVEIFLPNRLREALGIMHHDRRLARDAYALSVLVASRERLRLVAAHRDAEGNPLSPSRLLFAADGECVVQRARRFFGELPPALPRRNLLSAQGVQTQSLLRPPVPEHLPAALSELSVTKFRDYIACPYRFYLKHILRLEAISDQALELDGGAFGQLVHAVLEQFGRAEDAEGVRGASEPKQILDYLEFQLDRLAAARFGLKHTRPAVRVQIEQVRLRLRAFADWQAQRSREGWRIIFGEDSDERREALTAEFPVDEQPFRLRGRIDRIDFHEPSETLQVLDYKTADAGEHPQRTHRRGSDWTDLQLPLYRHLLGAVQSPFVARAGERVKLGYVLLPRDMNCVGLAEAEWQKSDLESADETAREIVRSLRQQKFWPPGPVPEFPDDFAAICQDRRLGPARVASTGDAA
jgi:ATP-dependent helicase/nuclease subunit B